MARAAVEQVSWEAVLAFRMERQHLASRAPASALVDVVSEPFARPSAAVRDGVRAEAARLAAFLGLDPAEPEWAAP